jgi:chromosome segregation ATPase
MTTILELQEQERIQHLEAHDRHRLSMEELTNSSNEKIRELESLLQTHLTRLDEKEHEIIELKSSLLEMTETKERCEKQRDEQIERFETYQEMVFENEKVTTQSWEERRKILETTLVETEEALCFAQSTIKTYVSLCLSLSLSLCLSLSLFLSLCLSLTH